MNQVRTLPPLVILDTNILVGLPDILKADWQMPAVDVYLLNPVLAEIEGLARDKDPQKAAVTSRVRDDLIALRRHVSESGLELQGGALRLFFADPPQDIPAPLRKGSVDHAIIAFAQECLKKEPGRFCAIVTQDRELADIASAANPAIQVIAANPMNLQNNILPQLIRKSHWWGRWYANAEQASQSLAVKRSESPRRSHESQRATRNPAVRLQKVTRGLYRHIKTAHYRTVLSVVPLEIRLAVAAQWLGRIAKDSSRILLLFVRDQEQAEYWAQELRKRCELPVSAVVTFHGTGISRTNNLHAVIYQFDQIEQFLNQHAARFRNFPREMSVLVNDCDLIPTEKLAALLFCTPQFVGFTLWPFIRSRTPSGKLLEYLFEQQTIPAYRLRNGEADGWLRPFDLICHPISLESEVEDEYARINAKFIEAYEQVLSKYPALTRVEDWEGSLKDLLETVADVQIAELFRLREQREEMVQVATGKLNEICTLFCPQGAPADLGNSIIYDPCGIWTPVLETTFAGQNLKVQVAPAGMTLDEWETLWRDFDARKLDVPILSEAPPLNLCRAPIHRLVITTPIADPIDLSGMADWALMHSHLTDPNPLEIHLLYVPNSPEEEPAMAFAHGICGL